MQVWVALLRGVNVGGKGKLPMTEFRALLEQLGCSAVKTYIQSGNAVFAAPKQDWLRFAAVLEARILEGFGVKTRVLLRSAGELRETMEQCPFVGRADFSPTKLQVTFLERNPEESTVRQVLEMSAPFEEVQILGRVMYGYFANGVGQSKLPFAKVERALGMANTARNWNSVGKLREMAESLELECGLA
jgi:uncharacterized protein (DUF1697 family)